jgi:formamidopyrimidine-DNA glycosylase
MGGAGPSFALHLWPEKMPELPEVEVTRRQVTRIARGTQIIAVWTSSPSYFFVTPPARLRQKLEGKSIDEIDRHGKYILLSLDDGSRLLLHLGMTGQLISEHREQDHVHLRLQFANGHTLTFRDIRKFGKVEWIAAGKSSTRLDKLGPDALLIALEDFRTRLARRKIAIKQALLDQSILAGVGNIYADEALFSAKISPLRASHELLPKEVNRLLSEVQKVLRTSIQHGGSTINDYMKPDGELGGFQDWHRVYGRTGEPCPRCRSPISRTVLGGRSTHYCLRCQK